jgi:endonuclease I
LKFKALIFLLLAWSLSSYAQDSVYYQTAFNSSGDTLKMRLHDIIKGHTSFPYTSSGTDTWDILKQTDRDPNNSSNVILIYSNRSVDGPQEFNNGNGWNREHVWPRSRGDFSSGSVPGTDVHHLRPCDISVNSVRENRNFDDCVNCQDVIDNGFNTGSKTDASLYTFEPPDNVKGDIARMIFYMAVRYEGGGSEPDLELTNTLQSNTSKAPLHAVLNTLLDWNRNDTVDNFERNRNQVIYSFQGNKNPFIDYPELAEYLWGDSVGATWKPATVIAIEEEEMINTRVYPNPVNSGVVSINTDEIPEIVFICNSFGREFQRVRPTKRSFQLNLQGLKSGIYFLELIFPEGAQKRKLVIEN